MSLKISLIISTYGRYNEVKLLLDSLVVQDCNLEDFEVIIIDQNDVIDLYTLVAKFEHMLNIVHYKTDVKGLSKAKNKGIDLAKGSIITFPDDDCTFYPDTISRALNFFEINPKVDVVYGSVVERSTNTNVMRNWPKEQKKLNLFNFSMRYSAITCFTKIKIKFNENYGVGAKISSGEELDYVIRAIKKYNVMYSPVVQVWHPKLDVLSMDNKKIYNYAYGYAAIMRKNCNGILFGVFMSSLIYQFARFFFSITSANDSKKYLLAIKGRLDGFLLLKK
ncbi:glycosyltransferase family 2 protein [Flavobacterium sp. EDS]|uniref:glycosyltransferase family 2 protein n=1 Tax=Flavobacterium sp. EDS TaxID=2897328 RepID=UPI001E507E66|nr:glycosyltransferase family 2 protein [Flavobacterium sp. EDS]MCD0473668.1 glycosyltransferase family 2 protein [Flavobacterium sp. EDS]